MSNQYVEAEVSKIVKDENLEFPLNMALAASWIIAHYKGVNIKVFDARNTSSLSDFYIIASMQNPTQARSAMDTINANLKKHGLNNISTEGKDDAEWILLDLGDIIVHLFQDTSREIFDLDGLWMGIPQIKIPQEYYSAEKAEIEAPASSGPVGYF